MRGWLKVHRKVYNHWLWKDPIKFQWWLIMLFEVNYVDNKMMLGNQLIEVKRGSSTNSLRTWGNLFQCGTKAVTNFFDLLESDEMITRRTLGKGKHSTTLINIANYEQYQTDKETLTDTLTDTLIATQGKREGHTIKEGKNFKEVNKGREKGFRVPTKNQIFDYMLEKGLSDLLAEKESNKFLSHYESIGWKVGKNKMKIWKSSVTGWINRMEDFSNSKNKDNGQKESRIGRTPEKGINDLSNPESWSTYSE